MPALLRFLFFYTHTSSLCSPPLSEADSRGKLGSQFSKSTLISIYTNLNCSFLPVRRYVSGPSDWISSLKLAQDYYVTQDGHVTGLRQQMGGCHPYWPLAKQFCFDNPPTPPPHPSRPEIPAEDLVAYSSVAVLCLFCSLPTFGNPQGCWGLHTQGLSSSRSNFLQLQFRVLYPASRVLKRICCPMPATP